MKKILKEFQKNIKDVISNYFHIIKLNSMPTIKIEEIVKSPKTLKANTVDREAKETKEHLASVRKTISHSSDKSKVDWERLRGLRFDF